MILTRKTLFLGLLKMYEDVDYTPYAWWACSWDFPGPPAVFYAALP
jgi:hypothetical protein